MNTEKIKHVVENIIKNRVDPYLKRDLISAGCLTRTEVLERNNDLVVEVHIQFGFPSEHYAHLVANTLQEAIYDQVRLPVVVTCAQNILMHQVQKNLKPLPNIKNIIAVSSGKGGVGKSTVAVNLALALQYEGATVGILDADIYGPSVPKMLHANQKPVSKDGKSIDPVMAYNLQTMSIGYLVDEKEAMIWRGPMATQALMQLLTETNWENLDYLIIDLPPGTGDIQLTLAQKIPVTGAVVVTTPQNIALLDARKGISMFQKVGVPILGVIENMSTHVCSHCGFEEAIFGSDGGATLASEENVTLLGRLPLDSRIRKDMDMGKPTVAHDPHSELALRYRDIAMNTAAKVALIPRDYAHKFPQIVVESGAAGKA